MRYAALACLALLIAACGRSDYTGNEAAKPAGAPVAAVVPAQPEKIEWKHQGNLDRAVRWILDNQKKKGDWGYMEERPYDIYLGSINSLHVWGNASTALCVMGLMMQPRTEEIDKAIDRALEYLIDAPDTPRATMDTFYNVWSHAYMIQALTQAMGNEHYADKKTRLKKRAEHELRRLLDHQSLDGGWGYYDFQHRSLRPSGDLSTPFTTAAALVALHAGRNADLAVRDHFVQIGLDYMERMRIPNGAYLYSTGHQFSPLGTANLPRGSLGRSQSGDNALFTWGRTIKAETLQKQLDYFFKDHVFIEIGRGRQFPHEAWYATAPYYYYFGHYYASRNVLGLPKDLQPQYGHKLAEFTAAGQYDDGSFWDYPLYGYHKPYGTGYGVIILSNCKQAIVQDAP